MANLMKTGKNILSVIPVRKSNIEEIKESNLPQEKKQHLFDKYQELGALGEEINKAKERMAELNHNMRRSVEYAEKKRVKEYTKTLQAVHDKTRHELRGIMQTYNEFDLVTNKERLSLDI